MIIGKGIGRFQEANKEASNDEAALDELGIPDTNPVFEGMEYTEALKEVSQTQVHNIAMDLKEERENIRRLKTT